MYINERFQRIIYYDMCTYMCIYIYIYRYMYIHIKIYRCCITWIGFCSEESRTRLGPFLERVSCITSNNYIHNHNNNNIANQ